MDEAELTTVFAELGAADPTAWAHSQAAEGINQLARYLFLRGCWNMVLADGDVGWIDAHIASTPVQSTQPFAGVAHALRRLLGAGADPADISEVVRGMQAELVGSFCYQLSDSDSVEGNDYVKWALFELDENDEPTEEIGMLHESVLETDPTRREMRPPG